MPEFDPDDDYPDDVKRNPQGFDLLRELKKPTAALRAWVKGSPRRGLSPGETVLVTAREEVVASEPGGGHYLPRSLPRRPQGTEVARWFVALAQVAEDPERPGEKKGAARRSYILPEGLGVRSLTVGDDKTLHLALSVDLAIASTLGIASPAFEVTMPWEDVEKLPTKLLPGVEPIDAIAAILRRAGVSGTGLDVAAERLDVAARAPVPTENERRAFVEECLAELRPRLVADLRERIFPYAFPSGTAEASFEVFHEALEELSILGYPLDADGEPVQVADGEGRRVDAPYLTVLPDREVVPARLRKQFARLAGVRFDHTPLVVQWFIAGWREAGGGERFPMRASVRAHDDAKSVELPTTAR